MKKKKKTDHESLYLQCSTNIKLKNSQINLITKLNFNLFAKHLTSIHFDLLASNYEIEESIQNLTNT